MTCRTRRRLRHLITFTALLSMAVQTSGCALALTGYLIGDGIQRSKAADKCRSDLKTINDARIAKGQDAFPDTCAQ